MKNRRNTRLLISSISLILLISVFFTWWVVLKTTTSIESSYKIKTINTARTFASGIREDIYALRIHRLRQATSSIKQDSDVLSVVIFDGDGSLLFQKPRSISSIGNTVNDPVAKELLRTSEEVLVEEHDQYIAGTVLKKPTGELLGGVVIYLSRDSEQAVISSALTNTILVGFFVMLLAMIPMYFMIRNMNRNTLKLEKVNEQLKTANKAKEQFLANMSHELRTPMNSVIGYCELLSETSLPQEQKEWVSIIQHNGDQLIRLINQILRFTRIRNDKFEVTKRPVAIQQVIQRIYDSFHPLCQQKGLNIGLNIDSSVPPALEIDPDAFTQCLNNLISNSLKFTTQGSIDIKAWTEPIPHNSTEINFLVSVRDTGRGISEQEIGTVFKAFSHLKTDDNHFFEGTGLGLNITKSIVELFGGRISVESEVGEGSVFTIQFPATISKDKSLFGTISPTSTSHDSSSETFDFLNHSQKPKIIVAEDNHFNQRLILKILNKIGFESDLVEDGEELLNRLSHTHYDVILMDINMPNMNGLEATKRIRASAEYSKIKIIALTATANDEFIETCYHAGMDDFISKPFRKSDLEKALKGVISEDSHHS